MGGIAYPPPGTLPYKTSRASNVLQGIGSFMQNYIQQREADKSRNLQEFMQQVQLIQLGVPVDLKKTMKAAKKAGLPLQTEGPIVQQAQGPQAPPQQFQLPSPGPGVPGAQMNWPGAPPPTVATQPPPPSGFQKFSQAMGWSQPPVSMNSPAAQWLQGMQQQGMQNQQMAAITQQNQMKIAMITQGALAGDPQAQEMARSLGILKSLDKHEWLYDLGVTKMGMTPEEVSQRIWEIEGAPLTNVIADYQAQMARLNFDRQRQAFEIENKLLENFPLAPPEAAQGAAASRVLGDMSREEAFMSVIRKTPTRYELERGDKDWQRRVDQANLGLRGEELATSKARLSLDERRVILDELQNAQSVAREQFDQMTRMLASKEFQDADDETKNAMIEASVSAVNAAAGTEVLRTETVKRWFPWQTPQVKIRSPQIGFPTRPSAQVGTPGLFVNPAPGANQWIAPGVPASRFAR